MASMNQKFDRGPDPSLPERYDKDRIERAMNVLLIACMATSFLVLVGVGVFGIAGCYS